MSWAEDQTIVPANRRPQVDLRKLVDTLAERPGDWFALGTYPADRVQTARSRGNMTVKRYPILDYSVMPTADDNGDTVAYVLYVRVRP